MATQDKTPEAITFAHIAHQGQFYGDVRYTKHLRDVVIVLCRFGFKDDDLLCAGWLHDVIEDTCNTYQDIKKCFGKDIAEIVYAVTDELGRNRKERKEKTYPKIKSSYKASIVKLADRIANVEYSIKHSNESKLRMYGEEQVEFRENLFCSSKLLDMLDYLEALLLEGELII